MRMLTGIAALAVILIAATPAAACLPPPPGAPDPVPLTPARKASAIYQDMSDIVYGVVVREADDDHIVRFKVLHVYKGESKPGAILSLRHAWGFFPPPCTGMMGLPPTNERGTYGVRAFDRDHAGGPELRFLEDGWLEAMFDAGLIRRARESQRVGTGSGPE